MAAASIASEEAAHDQEVQPQHSRAADADEHLAQALDLVGEGVRARDDTQPAGHDGQGVEGARGEEQRHHDQLADAHEALALLDHGGEQHRHARECGGAEGEHRERAEHAA